MKTATCVLVCVVLAAMACSGSNGAPGATGSKGDPGIVWEGTWSAGTTYTDGDAVQFNGSAWVSIQDANQGNSPDSSPAFWELLAMKGDTGDTGDAGMQGPAGLACWDLNGNSACDTGTEDITGDSMCTVADCRGAGLPMYQWEDSMGTPLDTWEKIQFDLTGLYGSDFATKFTDMSGVVWLASAEDGQVYPWYGIADERFTTTDCTGPKYLPYYGDRTLPNHAVAAWLAGATIPAGELKTYQIPSTPTWTTGKIQSSRTITGDCQVENTSEAPLLPVSELIEITASAETFVPPYSVTPVP